MRGSPTVRATLKAVSQGVAVASRHMHFQSLDEAIVCGRVDDVSSGTGPRVVIRAWENIEYVTCALTLVPPVEVVGNPKLHVKLTDEGLLDLAFNEESDA